MHERKSHFKLAFTATIHCLTGCSIGEILGMVIGTYFGFSDLITIVIAIVLAFLFGYSLTLIPLLEQLTFRKALGIAFASDTASISSMEIVDNLIIILIPGTLSAGLNQSLFWISLFFSLFAAFMVTVPVNYLLIKKGKGHSLVHHIHS